MGSVDGLGERVLGLLDDLDELDGREFAGRLQDLERLARRVERTIVGVLAEADRRAVWSEDGHRSVRGWSQATCRWSYGETTARLRTAALLHKLPLVDEAMRSGGVGVAQVRELARAGANPRCGSQLGEVAELLVGHAQTLPFDDFRRVVARWEALADADGAHHDHEAAHDSRTVNLDPVGAGWELRGRCGASQGAAMAEILDRFTDAEYHADVDDARRRLAADTPVTAADLARTASQRRWDAMHAIFCAAASAESAGPTPAPIVDIVVDEMTFSAALTAMATGVTFSDILPPTTPADIDRRRCETINGDPIDPFDAVAAAVVGHVRRVVYDSRGCVIDLGVASRLYRGSSRTAAWLQGTRCLWPGCGLSHCQVDHTVPSAARGPTNPTNAGALCGRHNRWKTRGYTTWRDPTGRWHTTRPDGTEIVAA
jgi:Domain of unknown function (DUF222)